MARRKLEVNDLRISFRTNSGILEAVRGISFDLEEGETLAIVGESGSGKSVTSRAIMGILAKNSIVEGGEIFYDGLDLLQISEEQFHQLRGNNISMIFQDPLSSLNPIVRVGLQMTEAMLANNKSRRKEATRNLKRFKRAIEESALKANPNSKVKEQLSALNTYQGNANKLAANYNNSISAIETIKRRVENALIEIQGTNDKQIREDIDEVLMDFKHVYHPLTIKSDDESIVSAQQTLVDNGKYFDRSPSEEKKSKMKAALQTLDKRFAEILAQEGLDYGSIGYAIDKYSREKVFQEFSADTCATYKKEYDENFLNSFTKTVEEAVDYEDTRAREAVAKANEKISQVLTEQEKTFSISSIKQESNELISLVSDTVNNLSVDRDSLAFTFKESLNRNIRNYEDLDKIATKDDVVDTKRGSLKPSEKLEVARTNIIRLLERLQNNFKFRLANKRDAQAYSHTLVNYIDELSRTEAYKLNQQLAKSRAISIMQEVGIDNARRRFSQYPFEFSGGMRQRIVIAIALSSNPDILICDEPTTALDVTIQAQILELIKDLKRRRNLSVIFITHDLGVVANIADKIAVMYAGKIVEIGSVDEVFYKPAHPYTWALLSSMPDLETKEKLESIPGVPPNMVRAPKGDAFAERNKHALAIDFEEHPPFFEISDTHKAATWLLHPNAPKVEPPKIVQDRIARSLSRGDGNE